jgi:hypothetical protein
MHEVRADYSRAMQRAMLDYVLSNPLERQRLGLQGLEPLLVPRHGLDGPLGPPLGSASQQRLVQRQLPQEWHEHVALARCGVGCVAVGACRVPDSRIHTSTSNDDEHALS